jgi:hypothetical protein
MTAITRIIDCGTYWPNKPGARTIAKAEPAYIGTERVSVEVDDQVTLFHGLRIVYTGGIPEGVQTASELLHWAATHRPSAAARVVRSHRQVPKVASTRVIDSTMDHAWLVGCEVTACDHRVLVAKYDYRPVDFTNPDGPMVKFEYTAPGRRLRGSIGPTTTRPPPAGGGRRVSGLAPVDPVEADRSACGQRLVQHPLAVRLDRESRL